MTMFTFIAHVEAATAVEAVEQFGKLEAIPMFTASQLAGDEWESRAVCPMPRYVAPIDGDDGSTFEAWTNGYAVGYKVTVTPADGPDEVSYIYLNPSQNSGIDDVPCAFLYQGPTGDPAQDEAVHHYHI